MTDFNRLFIAACLLLFPLQVIAADEGKVKTEKGKQQANSTVAKAPAYKPPLRGAPAGRVGGGTRGATERESFSLQVLAPDHVGYTTQEQPCLYWFISKPTSHSVELTVTEKKAVAPLVEKLVKGPEKAGIQSICLADLGVRLKKNVQYKWFVSLVTDAEHRSKDILAGGIIELSEPSPSLATKLKGVDTGNVANIYAEEGIWYDSLWSMSRAIELAPANDELRQLRASFLGQVGLTDVAEYEKNSSAGR
jgi:hypothetical protein